MGLVHRFESWHRQAKHNRWLRYFTVFNRVALAAGFLPSGFVKIMGERFTALSVNHPMGNYLEALHLTGYYYTFIGIMQVTAAVLLLIPRTATLGAMLYFPIILNICILSLAVCFDGSLLSSPLMVLANLYLLCWDYGKLKFILFRRPEAGPVSDEIKTSSKFPVLFFAGVAATVAIVVLLITSVYTIKPHNTIYDCQRQCAGSENPEIVNDFCECIHTEGQSYEKCVTEYKNAVRQKQLKNGN